MKRLLQLVALVTLLPTGLFAQDDMYFGTQKQKSRKSTQVTSSVQRESGTAPGTSYRYGNITYTTVAPADSLVNDTLYIDPNETFYDGQGEWVNGFRGDEEDFLHAKRVNNWSSYRSAIPVGSQLYWDLVYGPYSYDWNVYRVGGLAYATPSWTNPLYHTYAFDVTWGWHSWWRPSWRYGWYSSWGPTYVSVSWGYNPWYDRWYDPWWGPRWGYHWHHASWYGPRYYARGWYRPLPSRSNARMHFAGNSRWSGTGRIGRSTDRPYRISDNGRNRSTRQVSGHSVRTENRNHSASVREAARQAGLERSTRSRQERATRVDGQQVPRRDMQHIRGGAQGTREGSTYTRSTDGRRSTYTRPSSTRETGRYSDGQRSTRSSMRSTSEPARRGRSDGGYTRSSGGRSSYSRGSGSSSTRSYSGSSSRSYSGGSSRGFSGGSSRGSSGGGGGGRGGRR